MDLIWDAAWVRYLRSLLLIVTIFCTPPLSSLAADENEIVLAKIAEVTLNREVELSVLNVKWRIEEKISPITIKDMINGKSGVSIPTGDVTLNREYVLFLQGNFCRLDEVGTSLFMDGKSLQPVAQTKIKVRDKEKYHMYSKSNSATNGIGQFNSVSKSVSDDLPFIDDVSMLPIFLYTRPSWSRILQEFSDEKYERDVAKEKDLENEVVIADKKGKQTFLFFDRKRDYLLTKIDTYNRSHIEIKYADYKEIGLAPSEWILTQYSKEGAVKRSWKATVDFWSKDKAVVDKALDFRYPTGTTVRDMGKNKNYKIDNSDKMVEISRNNLLTESGGWFGLKTLFIFVNLLVVGVIGYAVVRKRLPK